MGKQLHIYNLNPMDGLVWALLHLLYLYETKCALYHSRTLGKVSQKKNLQNKAAFRLLLSVPGCLKQLLCRPVRPISSPHILENRGGEEAQGTNTASAEACRLFFFFSIFFFFFFSSLAEICVRLITGAKLRRRTLIEFEVGKI